MNGKKRFYTISQEKLLQSVDEWGNSAGQCEKVVFNHYKRLKAVTAPKGFSAKYSWSILI